MAEHPSITDWITAAATTATAFAAAIAGFIAWLAFQRDLKNQLPIIEPSFLFEEPYWVLNLIICNRTPETIVITSTRIRQPKKSLIARPMLTADGIEIKPTSNRINLNFEIGRFRVVAIPGEPTFNANNLDLYLVLPSGWESGTLIVDLRISSKALTLRDKRMVIKRFISAPTTIKTAPISNIPA
jgi:hypothetical protein